MNTDGISAMYRDIIIEEYKHPQNVGKIETPTHTAHVNNPTCGDEITVTLIVKDKVIADVKYEGVGCAISQASASFFTTHILGKKLEEIQQMDEQAIVELLGFPLNPMRMKCAVLIMRAIDKALNDTAGESQC